MGDVILREFCEKDKNDLVELAKIGLSKEFSIKRWDWLYHNDKLEGSHIVVAEYEGKIVGSVGAIKKRFVRNGEEFLGARHLDPVVDISMRGKGVFPKMLNALNEMNNDVDFIYTFPNEKALPGFVRSGYTPLDPIPVGYCHMAFKKASVKDKFKYFKTGARLLFSQKTDVASGTLQELKNCEWNRPVDKYSLNKDYSYLTWRYGESPVKKYDFLICRNTDGDILNACIVAKSDHFITIVDLLEYKQPIVIKDYLVAIQRKYGSVVVALWKTNITDRHLDSFFWTRGGGWTFLVRDVNNKMPADFFESRNWFISHGEVESN